MSIEKMLNPVKSYETLYIFVHSLQTIEIL